MVQGVVDAPPAYQAAVANPHPVQNTVPARAPIADTPASVFELLITVTLPPKRVRAGNKKTKTAKPETVKSSGKLKSTFCYFFLLRNF